MAQIADGTLLGIAVSAFLFLAGLTVKYLHDISVRTGILNQTVSTEVSRIGDRVGGLETEMKEIGAALNRMEGRQQSISSASSTQSNNPTHENPNETAQVTHSSGEFLQEFGDGRFQLGLSWSQTEQGTFLHGIFEGEDNESMKVLTRKVGDSLVDETGLPFEYGEEGTSRSVTLDLPMHLPESQVERLFKKMVSATSYYSRELGLLDRNE